ncbi:MAG: phosphatase PAP2 family protein [Ignavibacteria bacterium]
MITSRKRIKYLFVFILVYAIWGILYSLIGHITSGWQLHDLSLSVDSNIPFIPSFEYIYFLCYIIPFAPLFVIDDSSRMNALIWAFIIMNLIAFVIFLIYPVVVPRPPLNDDGSVTSYLINLQHSLDKPVNNFPSLHAANALLIFLLCRGYYKWLDVVLFLVAVGIGIAALLVKQHYILDIISGYILAVLVYFSMKIFVRKTGISQPGSVIS